MADQDTEKILADALQAAITLDSDLALGIGPDGNADNLQHAAEVWRDHRPALFFALGYASRSALDDRPALDRRGVRIPPSFTPEAWADFTEWLEQLDAFKGKTERAGQNVVMLRTLIADHLALLDEKYGDAPGGARS